MKSFKSSTPPAPQHSCTIDFQTPIAWKDLCYTVEVAAATPKSEDAKNKQQMETASKTVKKQLLHNISSAAQPSNACWHSWEASGGKDDTFGMSLRVVKILESSPVRSNSTVTSSNKKHLLV